MDRDSIESEYQSQYYLPIYECRLDDLYEYLTEQDESVDSDDEEEVIDEEDSLKSDDLDEDESEENSKGHSGLSSS